MGSTSYYWRVIANNGGHESPPSTSRTFNSATAATTLIFPADSSSGINTNPIFEWSSVANATSYTLQVSTSATFTTQTMVYNTAGITANTQQVAGLNPNTLYYWRVRTANGTEQGFYSPKFTFTTGTTTGIIESLLPFQIAQLSPNPMTDELLLRLEGNIPTPLMITITDMKGMALHSQSIHANAKAVYINTQQLAAGIYVMELQSAYGKITRKLVKH
jgi:hypothetical protein